MVAVGLPARCRCQVTAEAMPRRGEPGVIARPLAMAVVNESACLNEPKLRTMRTEMSRYARWVGRP